MRGETNANNLKVKLIKKNLTVASYVCNGWTSLDPLSYTVEADGVLLINGALSTSTDYANLLWQVVILSKGGQITYADNRGTVTFSTAMAVSKGDVVTVGPLYTGTMNFSGGTDGRYNHIAYTLIVGGGRKLISRILSFFGRCRR